MPERPDNSRFMDSFRSDNSMADYSRLQEDADIVAELVNPMNQSKRMMSIVQEEVEEESRKTESQMNEMTPVTKPAQVKPPLTHAMSMPVQAPASVAPKPAPIKPTTVLQKQPTKVSQIVTAQRRVSNIDRLKNELAKRQLTLHGGRNRMKDDSSDDNETSDDDDSDDE